MLISLLIVDPVLPHKCQRILRAVVFHELVPDDASEEGRRDCKQRTRPMSV